MAVVVMVAAAAQLIQIRLPRLQTSNICSSVLVSWCVCLVVQVTLTLATSVFTTVTFVTTITVITDTDKNAVQCCQRSVSNVSFTSFVKFLVSLSYTQILNFLYIFYYNLCVRLLCVVIAMVAQLQHLLVTTLFACIVFERTTCASHCQPLTFTDDDDCDVTIIDVICAVIGCTAAIITPITPITTITITLPLFTATC